MTATTRARGETSGRRQRDTPQAPRGMHPRSRTRCNVPMAPKRTVPVRPIRPKAGEAGAVVPTPDDCQPEKKWCQLVDHDGSGASCPTSGSVPKKRSRVPTAMTTNAMTRATVRWRPVLSGADRTRRPKRSRPARRPRSSNSSKSASSLKAEPTLPVRTATSRRPAVLAPAGVPRGGDGIGCVEALVGEAAEVAREPGAAPHLQPAHLGVREEAVLRQLTPQHRQLGQPAEVPPPGSGDGPDPFAIAGEHGDEDLTEGQERRLRQHPHAG